MNKQHNKEMEKRFDAEFNNLHLVNNWNYQECECDTPIKCPDRVKQFIKQEKQLSFEAGAKAERERIVKEYGFFNNGCGCCSSWLDGDSTIKDVLSKQLSHNKGEEK